MVGEVNNKWVMFGGITFAGVIGLAYYRKRKQDKNDAAVLSDTTAATQYADTSTAGGSTDPYTGLPYADETDPYAGYGGTDPATGLPYAYESYTNYGNTKTVGSITTNQAWVSQAEDDAQTLYGATYTMAQDAVKKYMAQSPSGLSPDEYTLIQSVIAELGQPPENGPYRLIQASGIPTGGSTGSVSSVSLAKAIGRVIQIPVNVEPPNTMAKVAERYGITVDHLLKNNPGKTASSTGVVNVPVLIKPGTTLDSLAKSFGDSDEHMAQILSSQGIV